MAKKDLSPAEMLQKSIDEVVKNSVKSLNKKLTEQEIKDIIINIMPNLDQMIANKIKEHFTMIAEFIQEKFDSVPSRKE